MLTVVDGIVSVAAKLFGMAGDLTKAGREKKDRLAEVLGSISDCLERAAAVLEQDGVPHGACGELAMYAQALPALVKSDRIPEAAAIDLGQELWEAHRVEGLISDVRRPGEREPLLAKMKAASGEFKALANILRL